MFIQDERKIYTRSYLIMPEFTNGVENVRVYAEVSGIEDYAPFTKNITDRKLIKVTMNAKYKVTFYISIDKSDFRSFHISLPLLDVQEWSESNFDMEVKSELEGIVDTEDFQREVRIYQENI